MIKSWIWNVAVLRKEGIFDCILGSYRSEINAVTAIRKALKEDKENGGNYSYKIQSSILE